MTELAAVKNRASEAADPSVWGYIFSVAISIAMIILICKFTLGLVPERSEFEGIGKVANETYNQYSQKLDSISIKYAKDLEVLKKGNKLR